jgi:hypothetical protein
MCRNYLINFVSVVAVLMLMTACTKTVKIKAPKEPITINLNIKLDAAIYVKLEEQAKKDIESNPDVF